MQSITCWSYVSLQGGLCLGSVIRNDCIPCTVIGGSVLHGDSIQLQRELVLTCVSGDRDEVLEEEFYLVLSYFMCPIHSGFFPGS